MEFTVVSGIHVRLVRQKWGFPASTAIVIVSLREVTDTENVFRSVLRDHAMRWPGWRVVASLGVAGTAEALANRIRGVHHGLTQTHNDSSKSVDYGGSVSTLCGGEGELKRLRNNQCLPLPCLITPEWDPTGSALASIV